MYRTDCNVRLFRECYRLRQLSLRRMMSDTIPTAGSTVKLCSRSGMDLACAMKRRTRDFAVAQDLASIAETWGEIAGLNS